VAQESEAGAAVHLPLDHLRFRVHAFGPAVMKWQGDGRYGGIDVDVEAAGERVDVREVAAPGYFPPEMTDQYSEEFIDSIRPRMLIPRPGRPEECAATLVWLVSPAAGYVTGQTIIVDGGVSIT
jgi:hypothetical protein